MGQLKDVIFDKTISLPKVSFVITTLDCAKDLELLLRSIIAQEYPSLEIVVVDQGSKDETVEIARNFGAKVFLRKGPLGIARRVGVENSNGEIIGLLDSDVIIPHKLWLRKAVQKFIEDDKISTVWPLNRPQRGQSIFQELYALFSLYIMRERYKKGKGVCGGSNSLFRKKYILEVGNFTPTIHWASDFEIASKLSQKGYKVIMHEDMLIHNYKRNFREFIKKEIVGSRSFLMSGLSLTGMSYVELLQEHILQGVKFMIQEGVRNRNTIAFLYPLLLITRILIYGIVFLVGYFSH